MNFTRASHCQVRMPPLSLPHSLGNTGWLELGMVLPPCRRLELELGIFPPPGQLGLDKSPVAVTLVAQWLNFLLQLAARGHFFSHLHCGTWYSSWRYSSQSVVHPSPLGTPPKKKEKKTETNCLLVLTPKAVHTEPPADCPCSLGFPTLLLVPMEVSTYAFMLR